MFLRSAAQGSGVADVSTSLFFVALVVVRVCRQDYNNLCQCESLEDVKLNLQETDYDQFLSQDNKVTPAILQDKATMKLVRACLLV